MPVTFPRLLPALLLLLSLPTDAVVPSEVEVPRDTLLNERLWGLIRALYEDDFESFCAWARESSDGGEHCFDEGRYQVFRKALLPFSKSGFTAQAQLAARPVGSTRHWYRAWLATLPSAAGKIARTASFIVVFDVDQPGRPIINIAVNPSSKRNRIPSADSVEEHRFESRR